MAEEEELLVLGVVLNVMAAKKKPADRVPTALSLVITAEPPPVASSAPTAPAPISSPSATPAVSASALPAAKPLVVMKKPLVTPPSPPPPPASAAPVVSAKPAPTPSNRALVDRK